MPPPEISLSSSTAPLLTPYEPPAADESELARPELPPGGVPLPDVDGEISRAQQAKAREVQRQIDIVNGFASDALDFMDHVPRGVLEGGMGMVDESGRLITDLRERDRVAANNLHHHLHQWVGGVGPAPALLPEPRPTSQTLQPLDAPQPSVLFEGEGAGWPEVLASRIPGVNLFVPAMQAFNAAEAGDAGELGRIAGRDLVFPMLLGGAARVAAGTGGSALSGLTSVAQRLEVAAAKARERLAALGPGPALEPAAAAASSRPSPWWVNESRAAGGGSRGRGPGGGGGGGRGGPEWPSREPLAANENPAAHIKNKTLRTGWDTPEAIGLVGLLARESGAFTDHVVQFLKDCEYDLATPQGQRAAIEAIERPDVREIMLETLKQEVTGLEVKRVYETALLERYFPVHRGPPLGRAVRESQFDPMHLAIKVAADLPEIRNTSLRDITRADPVLARVREDVAVRARNAMDNPARFASDPVLARMSPAVAQRVAWRDKAMDPQRFLPAEADMPGHRGAQHVSPEQRVALNEPESRLMGQQFAVYKDMVHVQRRLPEVRAQAQQYARAGLDQLAEVSRQVHEELSAWALAMADFVVR